MKGFVIVLLVLSGLFAVAQDLRTTATDSIATAAINYSPYLYFRSRTLQDFGADSFRQTSSLPKTNKPGFFSNATVINPSYRIDGVMVNKSFSEHRSPFETFLITGNVNHGSVSTGAKWLYTLAYGFAKLSQRGN
ncbi:MAG: hypothetical protein SFW35_08240 [Chitinophagales bacterium]|nr:hypothetical protein [Chitinophagales bacterium]